MTNIEHQCRARKSAANRRRSSARTCIENGFNCALVESVAEPPNHISPLDPPAVPDKHSQTDGPFYHCLKRPFCRNRSGRLITTAGLLPMRAASSPDARRGLLEGPAFETVPVWAAIFSSAFCTVCL